MTLIEACIALGAFALAYAITCVGVLLERRKAPRAAFGRYDDAVAALVGALLIGGAVFAIIAALS